MRKNKLLFALGLAAAAVYLGAELLGGPRWVQWISKGLPVLCLLFSLFPLRDRYAHGVALGLGLGLVGDLCMEKLPKLFIAGLSAFLLGHLVYTWAFFQERRRLEPLRALPVLVYIGSIFFLLNPYLGQMRVPVAVYVMVIALMVWRALALVGGGEPRRARYAVLGAFVFLLSDTLLACGIFVLANRSLTVPVMLLYWGAQWGIAASAGWGKGREKLAF